MLFTDWQWTQQQISTLVLQGNELNCESTGSIRNAPICDPLLRSRIRSTLKNLQTDDSRKRDLKMHTGFDWHGVKFRHTAFISNKECCHFHGSNSLLHASRWGSSHTAGLTARAEPQEDLPHRSWPAVSQSCSATWVWSTVTVLTL